MKRNYHRIIGLLAVLALFGLASAAYAEPPRGSFDSRKEARIKALHERLHLSAEQEALLEDHRARHRHEARELREKTREIKEALRDELQRPVLDMAQINQFHTTLKDLHGRRADHRLEGILEVRKILTPEQFSEFMELMERHRPWKGKGHGGPERRFK
jgi:Spy/CpxP family protein refolding chaperone